MAKRYSELPNEVVGAANGVDYAYCGTGGGEGGVPLVLLQQFRGNLDNWDPALIDALAPARRVVTFDNTGVGGSTGTTPDTIQQMAHDAIAVSNALEVSQAGLLGSPIGGMGIPRNCPCLPGCCHRSRCRSRSSAAATTA